MNWTLFSEKEPDIEDRNLLLISNKPIFGNDFLKGFVRVGVLSKICVIIQTVDPCSRFPEIDFSEFYAWCKIPTKEDVDNQIKLKAFEEMAKDRLPKGYHI